MSAKSKKSRSSIFYCQEKYSCTGPLVEATFRCEECEGSYQCSTCEAQLHSYPKFHHHDRYPLEPAPENLLCQLTCLKKNYADLHCDVCKLSFCFECDHSYHRQGRRREHKRYPHSEYIVKQAILKQEIDNAAVTAQGSVASDTCSKKDLESDSIFCSFDNSHQYKSVDHSSIQQESLEDEFMSFVSHKSPVTIDRTHSHSSEGSPSLDSEAKLDLQSAVDDDEHQISRGLTEMNSFSKRTVMPSIPDLLSAETSLTDDMDGFSINEQTSCIMLINDREQLQVQSADDFVSELGIPSEISVKIVSIFGNTGDGKSHTLNHAFFSGYDIFATSSSQESCTVGVWAAYDPVHHAIIIDTEGLLGVTKNQNQRTRLLLKILAISDVVIYRTRASKLHNDLFFFLHDASQAYLKHFTSELKAVSKRLDMDVPLSNLGPAVIIFHETFNTDTLEFPRDSTTKSANTALQERFQALNCSWDAFCSLEYVGTRTRTPPTDFLGLITAVEAQLKNTTVRSSRKPHVVFHVLEALNEKFSGDIEKSMPSSFPDQYFTCTSKCLSCDSRCTLTMNHSQDGLAHFADKKCEYKHSLDNKVFVCKACDFKGKSSVVVPKASSSQDNLWMGLAKYAWSGYVLECSNCGVIYQSRKYWYGNRDPEQESVVRSEIRHMWPGDIAQLQGTQNAARKLLDGVAYIGESVSSVSSKPSKMMSAWIADQIAPTYWVPNHEITNCYSCKTEFADTESKHHCRACGEGFCDECTQKRRPVPERGWGPTAVRVCDKCFRKTNNGDDDDTLDPVTARKVSETLTGAVGVLATGMKYPLDFIKESARPAYWVSDHLIKNCIVCKNEFGPKLALHHCRACGQGVCSKCSQTRRSVPARGWDEPVRICDTCEKTGEGLQK